MSNPNDKRVRITIDVDQEFVRLLSSTVGLKDLLGVQRDMPRQFTPLEVLGVVAMFEMRGAPAVQAHLAIPNEWRPHIEVVHDERRYSTDRGETWHKTGDGT